MGTVYRAEHLGFKEDRALKVVNPEYAGNSEFVERFRAEALITRQIPHPNIVRVEDTDETEDGEPFVVMEYVPGRSLREVLEAEHALDPLRALYIASQVCAGLTAAHQRDIIHRDIKPDNILIAGEGRDQVKLLDFGIAKAKEEAGLSSNPI